MFQTRVVVDFSRDNATSTRIATAGGIVHLNGDAYIFTAGHLFYETSTSDRPRKSKIIDDKWEIDSDSHSESDSDTEVDSYDKEFVESTIRASSSSSDDGSSDARSTKGSSFSDAPIQVVDELFSSMQAARRQACQHNGFQGNNSCDGC